MFLRLLYYFIAGVLVTILSYFDVGILQQFLIFFSLFKQNKTPSICFPLPVFFCFHIVAKQFYLYFLMQCVRSKAVVVLARNSWRLNTGIFSPFGPFIFICCCLLSLIAQSFSLTKPTFICFLLTLLITLGAPQLLLLPFPRWHSQEGIPLPGPSGLRGLRAGQGGLPNYQKD